MSTEEENIKLLFDRYSNKGDLLDDQWYEDFMDNAEKISNSFYIDWSNRTDSENYSNGDELESIYVLREEGLKLYWSRTSTGGFQGPFDNYDDAIIALGYDPEDFPPSSEEDDDEEEEDEEDEFDN